MVNITGFCNLADEEYDDPMTCVVELDQNRAFTAEKYHQFMKFNCPVTLDVSEERRRELMNQLLLLPVRDQRKLIWLYDPESIETPEEVVSAEMYEYVATNLLVPLSKEEFNNIETGLRLQFTYSKAQEAYEYKLAVGQYLTSIENPLDRKKADRVVELALEYLEGIGQWHKDYPF